MGITHYLEGSLPLIAYRRIRQCIGDIRAEKKEIHGRRKNVISLTPDGTPKGSVLLSYIIDGFYLKPGEPIPKTHTNIWQSVQMAQTFLELGYAVDAIHYTNHRFVPRKDYAFVVDVRHNLARLTPLLNQDCIKIMHIDAAHILFHNAAEARRLLELQQRRGVTLRPQRFEMPNYCIEHADYATTTGNDFTVNTFSYAKKKIFKLPTPCGIAIDWPVRDFAGCRNHFLWFSSSGPVHKGLDLALEAFADLPDCHLTICGPFDKDKAFVDAYYRELYETENIHTVGWVDLDSGTFIELTRSCCAVLHLSCSEGGAPSVKMGMHAGLIPIISYESGVDVEDFGYLLHDCSVANIKRVVKAVSELPQPMMAAKWRDCWEYARQRHTRENFSKAYRTVISQIIADTERR
jgi:glycosyltransferase involved in cell wall biosynthesis